MICLLLITFAGSLLLLCFLLWQKLLDRWVTENIKYRALISVLWVYLVPWVWLKRPYEFLADIFLRGDAAGTIGTDCNIVHELWGEVYGGLDRISTGSKWLLLVGIIWGSGVVVLMAVKILVYFYERKQLFSAAEEWRSEKLADKVMMLQKDSGRRIKVKLYRIPGERISFATGLIKPVIFLQDTATEREQDFILRHELIHTVRKDFALWLFLELVCCLHWFNPVTYVLKSCFLAVRETSCDERVLMGCSIEEREAYARLIAEGIRRKKFQYYSDFGSDYRRTCRRVELIMRQKTISIPGKWTAIGCFILLAAVNSLAAFFYP